MILGVAFVWFTTHFGGGFASGAQIYSYYVRYGVWSLFMPFLAMAYNGVFFAYCLYFARKHQVYDYRSYNDAFYGKYAPVFSNLFEVLYLCVMCVAPGGCICHRRGYVKYTDRAAISALHVTYRCVYLCSGDFWNRSGEKSSFGVICMYYYRSSGSVCAEYHRRSRKIEETISVMTESPMPFGKALYAAFLYGTFQLANVAVVRTACKII